MSDLISRDAAYAAVQALIKDATIIGQRTMISHALTAIRALPAMSQKQQSDDTAGGVCRAMTDAELDALVTRAMVIDPLLEVDFDAQRDVEQDPYGAWEAIETALYLIRDQTDAITTLRARLAEARTKERQWTEKIVDAEVRADRAEAALARTPHKERWPT